MTIYNNKEHIYCQIPHKPNQLHFANIKVIKTEKLVQFW